MTEVVLRHENPDVLPIIGTVGPDGSVVPNVADAGWSIDTDTDPVDARNEIVRRTADAEAKAAQDRPAPHFAVAEPVEVAPDKAADLAQVQPAPTPEPAPSEQGIDTSLDIHEGE